MGDSRFMSVKELATGNVLRTIPIDRSISFLLVVRDPDGQMYIPSTSFFDLVVNLMETTIITKHPDLYAFYWSSSKWRGCGFMDLPVDPMLEQWRVVLSNLVLDDVLKVDTFPKDSLLLGPDVTILLNETHLSYEICRMNLSVVCIKQITERLCKGYLLQELLCPQYHQAFHQHERMAYGVPCWG